MKYVATLCAVLSVGAWGSTALGQQPGWQHEQLKGLELIVGHWNYEGVDQTGRKVTGDETSEWIFNRTFLKTIGTWRPEGLPPLHYELITGWDPTSQRIVMVAPTSDGGYLTRVGSFDAATRTWGSQEKSVDGEGLQYTSVCTIKFLDANTWSATWTNSTKDGAATPDSQITATRVLEDPGLPQDVFKEMDAMVGDWKIEGQASTGPLKGTWHVAWAPGKQCLIYDFPATVNGVSGRGTGLWAWDASTGERVWHASYQGGGIETARVKPVSPGVFRGPYSVVIDGKTYPGTIEEVMVSPDEWTIKMTGLASQGIGDASVRAVRVGTKADTPVVPDDLAAQHAALEQKYFNYWKPHAGTWNVTVQEAGQEKISSVFAFLPSASGLYYVGQGKGEDGTPFIDGLYGYDAAHNCWFDVVFSRSEIGSHLYTGLLRADVDRPLQTGSTVSVDAVETISGVTVRYTATRVYKTVEKDRIVFVNQYRISTDGKALPDVTFTIEKMN